MEKLKIIENDLVSVYETSTGEKVVYGTELHTVLQVKTKYTDWISRRFNECDAVENKDFQTCFSNLGSENHGGQNKKEHIIQLDTAKEMAMLERNEIGKQVRRYFIKVEEKYKAVVLLPSYSYWQQTRQQTKDSRLLETECIKEFVAYANAHVR